MPVLPAGFGNEALDLIALQVPQRIPGACKGAPDFFRPGIADFWEHLANALPRRFVIRVHDHLDIAGDVFYMGLLEKAQAGAHFKGHAAPGQLHLEFHAVVVRPVEHRQFVERPALVPEFTDALHHKLRLLLRRVAGNRDGAGPALPGRLQLFMKLVLVVDDAGVGQPQYFRGAAVVGLELEQMGARIALGEVEDVGEVGAPETVDALRVIPHHHDAAAPR
ncbi:MAG: hypothetical protein BWY77_01005 [bacterium ADurb.Bin431]|nr:MAG: hypothetical protein BWY77_01005 [bacterium ADurb.Bin431]